MRVEPKKDFSMVSACSLECEAPTANRFTSDRMADWPPTCVRMTSYISAISSSGFRMAMEMARKPPAARNEQWEAGGRHHAVQRYAGAERPDGRYALEPQCSACPTRAVLTS